MLCVPERSCVNRADGIRSALARAGTTLRGGRSWWMSRRSSLMLRGRLRKDVQGSRFCSKIVFVYRVLIRRGVCWFYYYLSLIVLTCRCILSRSWVFEMITLAYKINIPLTFVWEKGGVLSFHRLRINHPELIYEEALHPTYVALFAPSPKAEKSPYPMSFFFLFFLFEVTRKMGYCSSDLSTNRTNKYNRSEQVGK